MPRFQPVWENHGGKGDKGCLSKIFADKICEINPDFLYLRTSLDCCGLKNTVNFLHN